jgi:hypothetical protein
MEQYLIQLIKDNNRVIIPEIGALIARNKDPLEIGFNGVLSFNDGLLTGHIIQAEDVTFKEANDKVMAYKDELLDQLNEKGEVILKDIGKITVDAAGNKSFAGPGEKAKESSQETVDSRQETVVSSQKKEEEEEEKVKAETEARKKEEEEKVKAEAEARKKEEEEKLKAEAEAKERSQEAEVRRQKEEEEKVKAEADAKKKADEKAIKPTPTKTKTDKAAFTLDESMKDVDVDASGDSKDLKATKDDPKSKPPFTLDESEQVTTEEIAEKPKEPEVKDKPEPKPEPKVEPIAVAEKKVTTAPSRKKKRVWIIPVGIVALLIIALVAGYFFFPEQLNRILPEKVASILPDRGHPVDESIIEEAVVEETVPAEEPVESIEAEETAPPVEEPAQEEPAEIVPAGKQYYIVAGCFENRANADKYASELQQEGFNSSVFGTRPGNLHAVCFNSFSSKSDALAEMRRIRQEKEPRAWVLYY